MALAYRPFVVVAMLASDDESPLKESLIAQLEVCMYMGAPVIRAKRISGDVWQFKAVCIVSCHYARFHFIHNFPEFIAVN